MGNVIANVTDRINKSNVTGSPSCNKVSEKDIVLNRLIQAQVREQ